MDTGLVVFGKPLNLRNYMKKHKPEKIENSFDAYKYDYDKESGQLLKLRHGKIYPMPEQHVFAEELCRWLNIVLHHDGSWRVIWVAPVDKFYDRMSGLYRICVPTELEAIWLDADGDAHCKVVMDDDVWKMLDVGLTRWGEICEEAYQRMRFMKGNVEIKPTQTFQQAKGEKTIQYEDAPLIMPTPA